MKKRIMYIFLLLFFISGKAICENEGSWSFKLYAENDPFFNSKIQSTTTDFSENLKNRQSSNLNCPMCGGISLGGICGSCSYSSGSALGTDTPINSGVGIFLLSIFSYLITIFIRLKVKLIYKKNH